jgi:hypothetical protein
MNRSSTNVSLRKRVGIPAADGGATDRNTRRTPAIRGSGTRTRSAPPVNRLPSSVRETSKAAFAYEAQVIAPPWQW